LLIRPFRAADAAALATPHAPEALYRTTSFETDPPDAADVAARLAPLQANGWPWLVIEHDAALLGYAHAS
jgi:phosphinothricin acetyltransferase